jgi:hypothetical protein
VVDLFFYKREKKLKIANKLSKLTKRDSGYFRIWGNNAQAIFYAVKNSDKHQQCVFLTKFLYSFNQKTPISSFNLNLILKKLIRISPIVIGIHGVQ